MPVLAETSTVTVSPPQSSASRPCSESSRFTRSTFTPGLSILLIATTKGTFAARVCADGFDRLRHHAVVCRDNEHHDIRDFGAASAHQRERFVARCIEERDLAVLHLHLICADVLRDTAVLLFGHAAFPDRVQQRGLSVIDVTHDRHHRRRAAADSPER